MVTLFYRFSDGHIREESGINNTLNNIPIELKSKYHSWEWGYIGKDDFVYSLFDGRKLHYQKQLQNIKIKFRHIPSRKTLAIVLKINESTEGEIHFGWDMESIKNGIGIETILDLTLTRIGLDSWKNEYQRFHILVAPYENNRTLPAQKDFKISLNPKDLSRIVFTGLA